ncbi:MAG: hypothetical protein MZV70_59860 [Desulfobacterales bacterium]|nr:hypothetical protein [Desulfobacterales bacterium]
MPPPSYQMISVDARRTRLGGDNRAFLGSGSHQRASGKIVGRLEEGPGALMNRRDGLLTEEVLCASRYAEMMQKIGGHFIARERFHMASCHHP